MATFDEERPRTIAAIPTDANGFSKSEGSGVSAMRKIKQGFVVFNETAVTVDAVMRVIETHQLKPVAGEYKISPAMVAEAVAIDKANHEPGLDRGEVRQVRWKQQPHRRAAEL